MRKLMITTMNYKFMITQKIIFKFSLRIPSLSDYSFSEATNKYLASKQFHTPTSIQQKVFTQLYLKKSLSHNYYIIAPTGNGKTLSYMIPMFQHLKNQQKQQDAVLTKPNRPRGLVLVSSSELVSQVVDVGKQMSHFYKLKFAGLNGGLNLRKQTQMLNEGVDIVASTLQRIQKHRNQLYMSYLSHLVIDQLDTLIDGGNATKLSNIIQSIKLRQIQQKDIKGSIPKIIFVSATFTNQIDEFFNKNFSVYERHLKFYSQQQLRQLSKQSLKPKQIADEFRLNKIIDKNNHINLQNIQHQFVHCETLDKHEKLLGILKQIKARQLKTSVMIFCSTIKSLHQLQYFLNQNKYQVLTLHGELPRKMRFSSIERFRSRNINILLCTDLGSRGLDFPFVSHVVNYDFPKTTSDYLHRSGRTGRAGNKGTVISLYHLKNMKIIDQLKSSKETGRKISIGRSAYTYMNKQDIKKKYKSKRTS